MALYISSIYLMDEPRQCLTRARGRRGCVVGFVSLAAGYARVNTDNCSACYSRGAATPKFVQALPIPLYTHRHTHTHIYIQS